MNRRVFQLFRAWLPSWRFFETLSEQPVLFYRVAASDSADSNSKEIAGEWRPALQRPPRRWYSIALNGEGNLHLASYALLDQLEEDISELDSVQLDACTQMPSYQLVQNLVCYLLRERNELRGGCCYQFKLSRILAHDANAFQEILVSLVHRA